MPKTKTPEKRADEIVQQKKRFMDLYKKWVDSSDRVISRIHPKQIMLGMCVRKYNKHLWNALYVCVV